MSLPSEPKPQTLSSEPKPQTLPSEPTPRMPVKLYNSWQLWELLHTEGFEDTDILRVRSEGDNAPLEVARMYLSQFEHLFFNQIMHSFLIHGNFSSASNTSPLSSIVQVLVCRIREDRLRDRVIELVFFCGLHLQDHAHPGPLAMIRSLITQLLRYAPFVIPFNFFPIPDSVDLEKVDQGDIDELSKLFVCLVTAIPKDVRLICVIDSIHLFENEQFWNDTEVILYCILESSKTGREKLHGPLALMLTSPQPTERVKLLFKGSEDSIWDMASKPDGLPQMRDSRFAQPHQSYPTSAGGPHQQMGYSQASYDPPARFVSGGSHIAGPRSGHPVNSFNPYPTAYTQHPQPPIGMSPQQGFGNGTEGYAHHSLQSHDAYGRMPMGQQLRWQDRNSPGNYPGHSQMRQSEGYNGQHQSHYMSSSRNYGA